MMEMTAKFAATALTAFAIFLGMFLAGYSVQPVYRWLATVFGG